MQKEKVVMLNSLLKEKNAYVLDTCLFLNDDEFETLLPLINNKDEIVTYACSAYRRNYTKQQVELLIKYFEAEEIKKIIINCYLNLEELEFLIKIKNSFNGKGFEYYSIVDILYLFQDKLSVEELDILTEYIVDVNVLKQLIISELKSYIDCILFKKHVNPEVLNYVYGRLNVHDFKYCLKYGVSESKLLSKLLAKYNHRRNEIIDIVKNSKRSRIKDKLLLLDIFLFYRLTREEIEYVFQYEDLLVQYYEKLSKIIRTRTNVENLIKILKLESEEKIDMAIICAKYKKDEAIDLIAKYDEKFSKIITSAVFRRFSKDKINFLFQVIDDYNTIYPVENVYHALRLFTVDEVKKLIQCYGTKQELRTKVYNEDIKTIGSWSIELTMF